MLNELAAFAGGLCLGGVLAMIAMSLHMSTVGRKQQRELERAKRLLNRMRGPDWH